MRTLSAASVVVAVAMVFAFSLGSAPASADERSAPALAVVALPPEGSPRINGLTLDTDELRVTGNPPVVAVSGEFHRDKWSLIRMKAGGGYGRIETWANGRFTISIPFPRDVISEVWVAIGPSGTMEKMRFSVRRVELSEMPTRGLHAEVGLTLSSISFRQEDAGPGVTLTEKAVGLKASAEYRLASRWGFRAEGLYTALPFGQDSSARIKLLAAGGGVNYDLLDLRSPWRFGVMGGAGYTTMFVSNGAFGFSDMMTEFLSPSFSRQFSNRQKVSGYVRLATPQLSSPTSSYEATVGMTYSWPLSLRGNALSVGADLSRLALNIDPVAGGLSTKVYWTRLSLGVGYSF